MTEKTVWNPPASCIFRDIPIFSWEYLPQTETECEKLKRKHLVERLIRVGGCESSNVENLKFSRNFCRLSCVCVHACPKWKCEQLKVNSHTTRNHNQMNYLFSHSFFPSRLSISHPPTLRLSCDAATAAELLPTSKPVHSFRVTWHRYAKDINFCQTRVRKVRR